MTNIRAIVFFSLLVFCFSGGATAQELNAQVSIDRTQINNTNVDWLETAVPLVQGFINDFKWSDQRFEEIERVQVQMKIIFSGIDPSNTASAQLVVSSQRPIYGTMQQTPVLNLVDDTWQFNFGRNRILLHDEQTYDAMGTVLAFYSNMILGFDADTFAPLGGQKFFEKAQQAANIAQNSGLGWGRDGRRRNRTYLVGYMLDPQYEGLRKAMYTFHREGIDQFVNDPEKARKNILSALKLIRETQRKTTEQYPFVLFFNTKFREIVRVFEQAESPLKVEVHTLLTELDPSHLSEYDKLKL